MATVNPPEVWSDLDHRLIQDAQGNLKKVTNIEAVMTSIDNILRTYKSERVMLPSFGADLRGLIFERMNSTLLNIITRNIKENIEKWDDRVLVETISIYPQPDDNAITISTKFSIRGQGGIFEHVTTIKGDT